MEADAMPYQNPILTGTLEKKEGGDRFRKSGKILGLEVRMRNGLMEARSNSASGSEAWTC